LNKRGYVLTALFALIVLSGKIFAFIRDIVISNFFGSDFKTDAYFVANSIPSLIFVGFFSTVSLVFLPHYNKLRLNKGKEESSLFASNVLNTYVIVSFIISLLGVLFSEKLVSIVAPAFKGETLILCIKLTRILCLSFLFSVSAGILSAIQNVEKAILGPQLIPVFNNLIVISAVLFLGGRFGVEVLAYSSVLAWILQMPLQYLLSRKMFNYRPIINLKDRSLKDMGIMMLPAFVGISIDQLNFLIDNNLGSGLVEGSISALNYSTRLINFFSGLFVIVIANVIYPKISDKIVVDDNVGVSKLLNSTLRVFLLIAVPLTIISCLLRVEIVTLVFGRGEFGESAISMTSSVFLYYSVGILFILIREVNNKVFYAKLDSKTPLFISLGAIFVNLFLSVLFVKNMGVSGLALATSISIGFYVLVQFAVLIKSIGQEFLKGLIPFLVRLLIGGVSMFLLVLYSFQYVLYFDSLLVKFLVLSAAGVSLFLIIMKVFKIKEIDSLSKELKSIGKKIRSRL